MKVAFCFLTQGNLLQPKLWDAFFADVPENRFTIYCHPKHPEQIVDGLLSGRVIDQSVKTHHAHISLVEATLALFRAAYLDDADNEYFVLVSESAIPIVAFDLVYDMLARTGRRSLIPYRLAAQQADHYARLQTVARPMLFASAFYVHDQWIILHRRHVQSIIDQSFLWLFERVFAPNEHYFLNVLFHLKGVALGDIINARTTFVNWREATRDTEIHPATGAPWTIVRPKTYQLLTPADLAEAQGAWFFRKITASGDCSLVLPRLAQRHGKGQTMFSSSRRAGARRRRTSCYPGARSVSSRQAQKAGQDSCPNGKRDSVP
jgi:Core-2/I-Branching enzyme